MVRTPADSSQLFAISSPVVGQVVPRRLLRSGPAQAEPSPGVSHPSLTAGLHRCRGLGPRRLAVDRFRRPLLALCRLLLVVSLPRDGRPAAWLRPCRCPLFAMLPPIEIKFAARLRAAPERIRCKYPIFFPKPKKNRTKTTGFLQKPHHPVPFVTLKRPFCSICEQVCAQ